MIRKAVGMGLLDMFRKAPKKNAIDLLQQISKRAEDLTPEEQARSFVAIRRIDGALKSRDSRVIFGRRGTGKTHILSYMATAATSRGDFACLIDLRTLGSNNSIYSDFSLSPSTRATTLIRDLLSSIHDRILEIFTDPQSKLDDRRIPALLDRLQDCVRTVVVTETQETRGKLSQAEAARLQTGLEAKASLIGGNAKASMNTEITSGDSAEWETKITGKPRLSVNMGDAYTILNNISSVFPGRLLILLDEWSSLPEELQPYLADFIRRAILPIQNISMHIAAIEYRSRFRTDNANDRVGLELGSDIAADINLDDYFVYDVSPDVAVQFFGELLYKHLVAFAGDAGLAEDSAKAVIANIFSQDRVFAELVRASEGVARDFINILQLAAMRSDDSKITMNEVRTAAKDWFERDKQRNLDSRQNAQELLHWIRDEVIGEKKARAFLLNVSVSNQLIDFLFDERVLHIARRSYSAKDDPGVRYRVWKVDYGCYVDLINTVNNPTSFLSHGIIFSPDGDLTVPDDDYRAVRRAILDIAAFDKRASEAGQ
ncbi:ORC-CDC6 family AAA ATPase [Siccirubricoccus phaeus]|uniref:ORC-CDC6 family AAA ATPase n=1 Tax=Siccirubricoccus phaeus TaxID=2595053 RepID=UPI0011F208B5|nr:hypothetical protein [Siccirubricoccus phaeus]